MSWFKLIIFFIFLFFNFCFLFFAFCFFKPYYAKICGDVEKPPFRGAHPEAPLFKGECPHTPFLGKLIPHIGELCPPASPQKGDVGKQLPRCSPHPGCMENVGGAPPTLGDASPLNIVQKSWATAPTPN
jgi:hypothetical protein